MKIIIGLGNPGKQYNLTRHNLGFLAVDFYSKLDQLNQLESSSDTIDPAPFKPSPKFDAHLLKLDDAILCKPQTFYNNAGECVSKLVNFYKLNPATDLLVICDDFDLPFGDLRYKEQGTSAGNNGLKSIIDHLSTTKFHRLRLGTNNPPLREQLGDTDFVLQRFTPEEYGQLPAVLRAAAATITDFIS